MKITPRRMAVGIRKLINGSFWRCGDEEPQPDVLQMYDVRRGRPRAWCQKLTITRLGICSQKRTRPRDCFAVEFIQYAGDERFRPKEGWAKNRDEQKARSS